MQVLEVYATLQSVARLDLCITHARISSTLRRMEPSHSSSLDYSKITDTLYLGTNACCQIHFDKELLAKGITSDISLEEERLDSPMGVDFFLWLPTKDHTPPSKTNLELGIQTLAFCERNRLPCYVHCKNGHGRGTTLIAAYLMRSRNMTADQALNFIKRRRPTIHLEESQRRALRRFEN